MQFIHRMVGALSKQTCTNIIDFFETNIHLAKPGGAGSNELQDLEIAYDIMLDKFNPNGFFLEDTLFKTINEYKEKFPLTENLERWHLDYSCQLMKYEPNQYYHHIHCENDGSNDRRVFAWMIYLNDIKEGGGTHFVHQNFTAEPISGDLYIWPAGWTHMHHGVNAPKETKYIITGWVNFI